MNVPGDSSSTSSETRSLREEDFLLTSFEEGRTYINDDPHEDDEHTLHAGSTANPNATTTTTEIILNFADNVTETLTEEFQIVREVITDVVQDVADDLQITYDGMQYPEEMAAMAMTATEATVAPMEPEQGSSGQGHPTTMHTRTHSLLPGDIAQAAAVVEMQTDAVPPHYHEFPAADTASLTTAADTLVESHGQPPCNGSSSAAAAGHDASLIHQRPLGETKSHYGSVSLASLDDGLLDTKKVIVEDPKNLVSDTAVDDVSGKMESSAVPLTAYLLLAAAVIGLSSIGPLLNMQQGVDPTIKIIWRNSATAVALFPLAVASLCTDGFPFLTQSQGIVILLTGLSYACFTVFFAWALEYTTISNTVILSNCHAILLLLGRAVMGHAVSLPEGLGALVAFTGAIICSRESAAQGDRGDFGANDGGGGGPTSLLGDGFAILTAVAGVAYLVTAKTVRPVMNLYSFMFLVMFLAAVDALLLAYLAGVNVSWDRDPDTGIFGWMNLDGNRLPLEMVMVISCQFVGAMGYIRCMRYFSNLVISVATLLEPVVADTIAVLLGVGSLPGTMGWIGNALVILGTLAVVRRPPSPKTDVTLSSPAHKTLEH